MVTNNVETRIGAHKLASPGEGDVRAKKRKTGIPTGHAGEYFVMGELLRRGFDPQHADRNTKGYDVLVGDPTEATLRKVQVKTVRSGGWFVDHSHFRGALLDQVTIYVLLGKENAKKPVRFFITRNRNLAGDVHTPASYRDHGFMSLKAVAAYEDRWDILNE